MQTEDILSTVLIGFLFGLFVFAAVYFRVLRWHRGRVTHPATTSLRAGIDQLFALDRLVDLVVALFIVAMLVYGAVVAPRLRYILGVAVITAAASWWVWHVIMKWMRRS